MSRSSVSRLRWASDIIWTASSSQSAAASRGYPVRGVSVPWTRIIGLLPALKCRSEASRSIAIFRNSSMTMTTSSWVLSNEGQPAVDVVPLPVDDLEEGRLDLLGQGAALAGADRVLVNRPDGRDLRRGTGEEGLVRDVEHLPRDGLLDDADPHLAQERDDRVPGDPRQHGRRQRRR